MAVKRPRVTSWRAPPGTVTRRWGRLADGTDSVEPAFLPHPTDINGFTGPFVCRRPSGEYDVLQAGYGRRRQLAGPFDTREEAEAWLAEQ